MAKAERLRELKHEGNRALVKRDFAVAEKLFRQLIASSAESPDGYTGLAKVFERTGREREIIDLLEPVISRMSSDALLGRLADAHHVLAAQGDKSSIDPGIDYYNAYLLKRRDPVALFYLGELLAERGEFMEAFDRLRESLEIDPRSPTVRAAAVECARKAGKPELASGLPKQ